MVLEVLSSDLSPRLVAKASLQRPYHDQILTAETADAITDFCKEHIPGIKFFNVTVYCD